MYSEKLKTELTALAKNWAQKNSFSINSNINPGPVSAVIFDRVEDNFHPKSFSNIKSLNNKNWKDRLVKVHSHFPGGGIFEMQSSNSSDALAMNIFCHPDFNNWMGVANLFGDKDILKVEFGHNPVIKKNGKQEPVRTEIDVLINGEIICESKLTESDFTEKEKTSVESYDDFASVFEIGKLRQSGKSYYNYQLIRNILAAYAGKMDFVLLCDSRRPDLVKAFIETVVCIKDISLRTRCKIIFWQDITAASGKDLKDFLKAKYGI